MTGELNCERAKDLLQDDLDGRLDAAVSAQLELHVAGCAACEQESRELADLRRLFQAVPPAHAPEGFADAVMVQVGHPPRGRVRAFPRWIAPLVAVAAVLLIAVSVLQEDRGSRSPEVASGARLDATYEATGEAAEKLDLDGDARDKARAVVDGAPESPAERVARFADTMRPEEESKDAKESVARLATATRQRPATEPAPRPSKKGAVSKDVAAEKPAPATTPLGGRPDAAEADPKAKAVEAPMLEDRRKRAPRRVFVAFHDAAEAERFVRLLEQPATLTLKKGERRAAADAPDGGDAPDTGGAAAESREVEVEADAFDEQPAGPRKLASISLDETRFKVAFHLFSQGGTLLPTPEGEKLLADLGPRTGAAGGGVIGVGGGATGTSRAGRKAPQPPAAPGGKARALLSRGEGLSRSGSDAEDDADLDAVRQRLADELAKVGAVRDQAGVPIEVIVLLVPKPPAETPASESGK